MKETRPRRRRSRRERRGVDIVPLVDVIFLLLCFFVLLSLNMVYQQSLRVNLAEAHTGNPEQQRDDAIVLTVRADGSLFLDGEEADVGNLEQRLNALREGRSSPRVRIHADGEAAHAEVIRAVDAVRRSGIEDVIFNVRPDS